MITTGGFYIPHHIQTNSTLRDDVLKQWIFSCALTLFALCISFLPRAHFDQTCIYSDLAAMPSSSKLQRLYYSAIFVWAAATTLRALTSLVVKFKILNIDSWMVALSCVVVFSLIVTCNFCNTREINR